MLFEDTLTSDPFDAMLRDEVAHRRYINKVRSIAPGNLIGYWPMNEPSGTLARGYGIDLEYLVNGGFETAGGGGADIWGTWAETAGDGALADEAAAFHGGAHAAKVTAGATANTKIAQTIATQPGTVHAMTFWTRGDGTNGGRYLVYDATGSANIIATTATGVTGTGYVQISVSFTAPANCVSIRIDLMCPVANGGICYFDDVSVMAKANGKYTGVTLGQPGIGDGFTCPLFDGATNITNVFSSGQQVGFNPLAGTLSAWFRMSASGVWTDGAVRYLMVFSVDANNEVSIHKPTTNNRLRYFTAMGGTNKFVDVTTSSTAWNHVALTYDKMADAAIAFINGVQSGATQTGLGVWAGSIVANKSNIGAGTVTPSLIHSGFLEHAAYHNIALVPAQIQQLARPR
jgi:hypothetical protein